MYREYYGLSAEPFRLTPDPRFVYAHRSYRKAQAYMRHTLEQGDGFLVVTGRSGTGKTTLVEDYLASLKPGNMLTATLVSTQLDVDDLLRMIAYAFGLDGKGLDKATLLREIQKFLKLQPRALLIIDEAQNLSESALEEVRMLTNMHHKSRPLLQVFLLGQPELRGRLHKPEMEPLHQRLMAACDLEPLSLDETREYVLHRLHCAGWTGRPAMTAAAFLLVHRFSSGLPRYISKLCARLFLHGAVERHQRLDVSDVVTVVQEIKGELLLPLSAPAVSDEGEPLPGMQDLIDAGALPPSWMVRMSAEEQAFLEGHPDTTSSPAVAAETLSADDTVADETPPDPAPEAGIPPMPESRPEVNPGVVRIRGAVARLDEVQPREPGWFTRRRWGGSVRIRRNEKLLGLGVAALLLVFGIYRLSIQDAGQRIPLGESFAGNMERSTVAADSVTAGVTDRPAAADPIGSTGRDRPQTTAIVSLPKIVTGVEASTTELLELDGLETVTADALASVTGYSSELVGGGVADTAELAAVEVASISDPLTAAGSAGTEPERRQRVTADRIAAPDPGKELPVSRDAAGPSQHAPASSLSSNAPQSDRQMSDARAGQSDLQPVAGDSMPAAQTSVDDGGAARESGLAAVGEENIEDNMEGLAGPAIVVQEVAGEPLSLLESTVALPVEPGEAGDIDIAEIASEVRIEGNDRPSALAVTDLEVVLAGPEDRAGSEEIAQLLTLGEEALQRDRLRFPPQESAWHYYREVLALDPENQDAGLGMQRISDRYAELASDRIARGEYDKGLQFVNRGLGVVAGDPRLLALRQEIQEQRAEESAIRQAREAERLAAAAKRGADQNAKAGEGGLFGGLKAFFAEGRETSAEQIFQSYDR